MRMNKYGNELELILLLSEDNEYTTLQLAERLETTRRNIYYYLDYLRKSGFKIHKKSNYYRIDPDSAFLKKLYHNITLTPSEATYIHRLLSKQDKKDHVAAMIRNKWQRFYHFIQEENVDENKLLQKNIALIKQAVDEQKIVLLKGYSSPNSKTVADRLVEPFMLMHQDRDVRCYEIKTQTNKIFKLSRIRQVEITDVAWLNTDKHRKIFTDIFMFSGEEKYPIKLRLGQLSHNLILEEFPQSTEFLTRESQDSWILSTHVASHVGVTRFVLGLYEDITVLGDEHFNRYVKDKIKEMYEK